MLNNFRKGANSFVIRILLAMVAFAFVGWGIKDVLQSRNNHDIVSFKSAKNISQNDFLKARSEEITMLQKQSGSNLSEEDIKQLGLERVVLQRLINDSILNNVASYYNLDLSDESVISLLKRSQIFKNEKGEFDIAIFKSMFRNSYLQEKEYLQNYKDKLLKSAVMSTFLESFKTPEAMINNIVEYMAERRIGDLVQIDLETSLKQNEKPSFTLAQLEEYYKNHKELFTIPEMRSLSYIKTDADLVAKKIIITEPDILDFYEENKEEYENKPLSKIRNQLMIALKQQKTDELMLEFAKNLEDEVAAGSTLKEIADKYEVNLFELKDLSYEMAVNEKSPVSIAGDAIFEMIEGEILYPVELQDKSGLILVELTGIKPARLEEFKVVEDKARSLLMNKIIAHNNMKEFENLAKEYNSTKLTSKDLSMMGIKINSKYSVARADLDEESKLPQGLLISMFQLKKGDVTPVFRLGQRAYFICISDIQVDHKKLRDIKKSSGENIATNIKNSIIEELVFNFIDKNNMKVNFKPQQMQ